MSSNTEIANLALSHLGHGKDISDLETEDSSEAKTARRFYKFALQKVAESAPWPFLRRFAVLSLVEEEPTTEWGYSYRYPANCERIVRVLSGIRNDDRQSRAPYKIVGDDTGKLIYTDEEDAEIEYNTTANNPTIFSAGFTFSVSYLLAVLMGPRLTSGDQFGLIKEARTMYSYLIEQAKNEAFNEQQDEEEPEAESIRVRE